MFTPIISQEAGLSPQDSVMLITIMGATNAVGRFLAGLIASFKCISVLHIFNISMLVLAVAFGFLPYCTTFWQFSVVMTMFGLFLGVPCTLYQELVVNMFGMARLTSILGVIFFCRGISALIGAPIIGFICEVGGSYTVGCFVATGTMLLTALLNIPLQIIDRSQQLID